SPRDHSTTQLSAAKPMKGPIDGRRIGILLVIDEVGRALLAESGTSRLDRLLDALSESRELWTGFEQGHAKAALSEDLDGPPSHRSATDDDCVVVFHPTLIQAPASHRHRTSRTRIDAFGLDP